MKFVYIDESGYTGGDLLNQEQPFQAASAIYISEVDAEELIKEHFPRIQSDELKYKNLSRKKGYRDKLLALQKNILTNFDCVTYICDKKFVLILHFLDYAVEPFYHARGFDFYKDGSNYALASLLYYTGDVLLGSDKFTEIIKAFQYAIKSKTDSSISTLISKVRSSNWEELPECFGPLAQRDISCIKAIKCENVSSDAAFIVLQSLISRLEMMINTEYSIKHDKSKNLEQYDIALSKMMKHEDNVSFKETSITTLKFPLKVTGMEQVESKDYFGVQLADVLAGGIIDSSKAITGVKINEYNKKIVDLYKDNQLIHLLPSLDFNEQKQFRKNTEAGDLINYFSKNFI
jgi:hypothetical protein